MSAEQDSILASLPAPKRKLGAVPIVPSEAAPQGSYAGNLLRSTLSGLSLGAVDEIEGAINSGLSQLSDDPKTYQQARGIARAKIKQFQSENPGVAITSEIVGGLIPTVIAMMSGVGTAPGVANATRLGGLGKRLWDATKIGSGAGVGYSEKDVTPDLAGLAAVAEDAAKGAGISMVGGEALRGAGKYAGQAYNWGLNKLRNKFGNEYPGPAEEYLNDLMKRTGKNIDEVIDDIENGGVMAEDEQLLASLRVIAGKGGDASGDIKVAAKSRASQTMDDANEAVSEALVPGQAGVNVPMALTAKNEAAKAEQAKRYATIYAESNRAGPIPKKLSDRIEGMMRINPQVRQMFIEDFNSAKLTDTELTPLFRMVKDDAGDEVFELLRPISLAEAEGFRRNLGETASLIIESKSKRNTPGFNYKEAEKVIRVGIDRFNPKLAGVRSDYSSRESVQKAIAKGAAMAGSTPDDIAAALDGMSKKDQAGFRAGMYNRIKKRMSDSGGTYSAQAGGLDVANRTPHAVMREILPEDQFESVTGALAHAGRAAQNNKGVKPAGGAITQFAASAGKELDAVGAASAGVQAVSGNYLGALISLARQAKPKDLGLNDKQLQSVVKVLFSEDPEFVRRALADNTTVGELNKRIIRIAQNMEIGGQNIVRRQSPGILEDF